MKKLFALAFGCLIATAAYADNDDASEIASADETVVPGIDQDCPCKKGGKPKI